MCNTRNKRLTHWLQEHIFRLQLLDYISSLFIVTPLAVGYYKGIIFVLEFYVFPGDVRKNLCATGLFGYGTLFAVTIFQHRLHSLSEAPREPAFYFVSKFYNLIVGVANVSMWWSVWAASQVYIADSLEGVLTVNVFCTMTLILLRCYTNVGQQPPFYLAPMEHRNFFKAPTRFRCKPKKSLLKFTLDVSFTVFVVNTLVALIWKNTWTFLDLALYPDNYQCTTLVSLISGISFTITLYALQSAAYKVAGKLRSLPRIMFVNCWLWFTGFTSIILWRGIWYVGDLFIEIESYGTVLPIISLLVLKTFFSDIVLATKGISHEFLPDKGQVVIYPIRYFQTISKVRQPQNQKSGKLLNEKEVIVTEKPTTEIDITIIANGIPETIV